jgi:heme A synthase
MPTAPAAGGEADLRRFRRLVTATIAATFALILIGGTVRVTDSGLGCGPAGSGTEGWPLCGGGILPFLDANAIVEFSHRIAATIVALLVLGMAVQAIRVLRDRSWIVRGTAAAGVLVLAQAALGGLTVEHGLHEVLVAAHLGLAMLLLGLLIGLRRLSDPREHERSSSDSGALRVLASVSAVLVLATIVAGGYVAGTEGEGTADEPILGAHTACGEEFPRCLDGFMPFGTSRLVDIHLTHRLFMYLTAIAVLAMAAVALRRRPRSRAFVLAGALLPLQVLLGAINVWHGEHPGLILAHLALGTLLWATVVQAGFSLVPVPGRAARPLEGTETGPQAAPA